MTEDGSVPKKSQTPETPVQEGYYEPKDRMRNTSSTSDGPDEGKDNLPGIVPLNGKEGKTIDGKTNITLALAVILKNKNPAQIAPQKRQLPPIKR